MRRFHCITSCRAQTTWASSKRSHWHQQWILISWIRQKLKLDRYTRYDTPQDRVGALHDISSISGRFNCGLLASRTFGKVESVVQANGELDEIVIIPIRDVPYLDARREIIDYIEKLQRVGETDFSAGEIARILRLDLDIVLDVLDDLNLL